MKLIQKTKAGMIAVLCFALSLGVSIPLALAANSIVTNPAVSPDPFYTQIPDATPVPTATFSYSFNSGGYPAADVKEQILDDHDNVVYYWGAHVDEDTRTATTPGSSETVTLTWDGKGNTGTYDGQFVPDGTYTFYVHSHVASPPDTEFKQTFKVEKAVVPAVELLSDPPSAYYTTSASNYSVNYSLKIGNGSATIVRLKIYGPASNSPVETVIADNTKNQDGNYAISWDGKVNNNAAPAGAYTYTVWATTSLNGYSAESNQLKGDFTVSNDVAPTPTFSTLTATPNPYDANSGSLTFGYVLNGSMGFTNVKAEVFNTGDLNTALKTWDFSNQASGSNTIVWDGKDSNGKKVDNGSYIFKLTGSDGNFALVPQQASFTVAKIAAPVEDQCAGFTDVGATDANCEAIKYVQSLGAMTGNPDGTFDQEGLLQRDQVSKIVLETFSLFNKQNDYCQGVAPFPDVGEQDWAFQYICRGVDLGMITGYKSGTDAGYYRPARSVNRVEFLALLLRNLKDTMPGTDSSSYSDVETGQWYSGYAKYSKDNNLFSGSKLYPTNFVSRGEVALVIYRLHLEGKI